jgi:hypothetical protein
MIVAISHKVTQRLINMEETQKHILSRLDNLEAELCELREVTWPVCQGLLDKHGPFENKIQKRKFFKFLFIDEIRKLLNLKSRFMGIDQASAFSELQWIRVEEPPMV